jgi:hypothetical protein
MSRRLLRCRNPSCPVPHGAVLGQLTNDDGLALDDAITAYAVYLDTRRVQIVCPACGKTRAVWVNVVRVG